MIRAVLKALSLPSSLEDVRLMTLSVSSDGSYEDEQGRKQYLLKPVLKAIQSMIVGQKILIVEERVDEKGGTRMW